MFKIDVKPIIGCGSVATATVPDSQSTSTDSGGSSSGGGCSTQQVESSEPETSTELEDVAEQQAALLRSLLQLHDTQSTQCALVYGIILSSQCLSPCIYIYID